ncbi:MAG: hypothetical protein HYS22_03125 [Deltaproteobacteria bacterium]|nr:hypothetical protein [Deltaproteobacteria bacterium]
MSTGNKEELKAVPLTPAELSPKGASPKGVSPNGVSPRGGSPKLPSLDQLQKGQLVSFGNRVTYTFIASDEVASLHFDKTRGEIFYKGHNIQNMELDKDQIAFLKNFEKILSTSGQGRIFQKEYSDSLQKVLASKAPLRV